MAKEIMKNLIVGFIAILVAFLLGYILYHFSDIVERVLTTTYAFLMFLVGMYFLGAFIRWIIKG